MPALLWIVSLIIHLDILQNKTCFWISVLDLGTLDLRASCRRKSKVIYLHDIPQVIRIYQWIANCNLHIANSVHTAESLALGKHGASLPKVFRQFFPKKLFVGRQSFFSKFMGEGVVLYGKLTIRSCQGRWGSFTKAIFSNLNYVNLKVFPNHIGLFIWK